MRKLLKKQSATVGLPPGTLVAVGEPLVPHTRVSVMRYDAENLDETDLAPDPSCPTIEQGAGVTWVMVAGLGQMEAVQSIGQCFHLHPLVLEDILNSGQRPKLEEYPDYLYVVAKLVRWNDEAGELQTEQISIVLGTDFLITFQESDADLFGPIRERIRASRGQIRSHGADYLAYALLDLVVDGYFVTLERLGEVADRLETWLAEEATLEALHSIHRLKRELVVLRRILWPLREAVIGLYRDDSALVGEGVRVYLRDVYDHTVHVIETAEALRDVVGGLLDLYVSTVSNQMNSVMKVLTIIATLFIPLTFVAGVYGMNFRNMPELAWRWGYPAVLGLMGVVTLGMVWYFRRKRWIG